jgi:hypothetical protein
MDNFLEELFVGIDSNDDVGSVVGITGILCLELMIIFSSNGGKVRSEN